MRVFLTSPWIPGEWVRAHGLESCGVWSEPEYRRGTMALSAGVCAFAEAAVRFAEAQPDSAVVFATSCDQLRRGFDAAMYRGQSRAFLFNLPATQTPVARRIYRAELERLGKFLVELGGSAPTPEILRHEMVQANLGGARHSVRADSWIREDGAHGVARPTASSGNHVPLALVGGPLSAADGDLLEAIESAGGRIVLNATENGERSVCPQFNMEAGTEPFDALADGCFENIVDVFQRPNTRLYAWLKPRVRSRAVRGIVLWLFSGCDLWRAEAQTLRETFGLPVLLLEAGETAGISPREVNRLQAFVETLNDTAFRGCDSPSQECGRDASSRETPTTSACLPEETGDGPSPSPSATGRRSYE
jgi:hypothetical protein